MRATRERRRNGILFRIGMSVRAEHVAALVAMGLLKPAEAGDRYAVERAATAALSSLVAEQ